MTDRTCSVEGCLRKHKARGLCNTHYEQQRTSGPLAPLPERTCSVEGCPWEKHYARGWCYAHYQRWKRTGSPEGGYATGERHPSWKGDAVGYAAAHERIEKARGKASEHQCVDCGEQAAEWSYRVQTGYSSDPDDYDPRCVSCHRKHDRAA